MTVNMASSSQPNIDSPGDGAPRKSRVALYGDDVRLCIIEEVYKKRFLWAQVHKEMLTANQKKRAYLEIAEKLKGLNSDLKADDIEKQWKNLKDTYIKVKKKAIQEAKDGQAQAPKWKFYRCLSFLDEEMDVSQMEQELQTLRDEHEADQPQGSRQAPHQYDWQIEHQPPPKREKSTDNVHILYHPGSPSTSTPRVRGSTTSSANGRVISRSPFEAPGKQPADDEHVAFCNSLVHPLREIAAYDKLEYYNLQKTIRDAIFDVQKKILSR